MVLKKHDISTENIKTGIMDNKAQGQIIKKDCLYQLYMYWFMAETLHPVSIMSSVIMRYVFWAYAVCHSLTVSAYIYHINNLCIIVMFTKAWSSIWTKYEACGTFTTETPLWIYTGPMLARVAYAFVYVCNRNSGHIMSTTTAKVLSYTIKARPIVALLIKLKSIINTTLNTPHLICLNL
jgi:hypothetical protein